MLLSLANELQEHIYSFQDYHNLTVLMRVNKSLCLLVEPMLYSKVELHPPDYHEYYRYPSETDSIPGEHRNYWTEASVYEGTQGLKECDADVKTHAFMSVFDDSDDGPPRARREALAQHVRLLCLELSLDSSDESVADPLGILASFQNLTHLELTMNWPCQHQIWDKAVQAFLAKSRPPLENLRTLRLRGYVPKEFVQYLCRGTTGISDLELAILDRPVSSIHGNPPPRRKSEKGGTREDVDADNLENAEYIAPRALATLGGMDLSKQFCSLTCLRLCRPAESCGETINEVYVSVPSDVAILKEWAALIRATRGTLEHLVLDQRPFAEEYEGELTCDEEFLRMNPYGPGYYRFVEYALPALIEEGAQWPRLKSIHLHGFDVPPKDEDEGVDKRQRLLEVVTARFTLLGVDVRSGLGRRMLYEDEGAIYGYNNTDGFGGRRWNLEDTE